MLHLPPSTRTARASSWCSQQKVVLNSFLFRIELHTQQKRTLAFWSWWPLFLKVSLIRGSSLLGLFPIGYSKAQISQSFGPVFLIGSTFYSQTTLAENIWFLIGMISMILRKSLAFAYVSFLNPLKLAFLSFANHHALYVFHVKPRNIILPEMQPVALHLKNLFKWLVVICGTQNAKVLSSNRRIWQNNIK